MNMWSKLVIVLLLGMTLILVAGQGCKDKDSDSGSSGTMRITNNRSSRVGIDYYDNAQGQFRPLTYAPAQSSIQISRPAAGDVALYAYDGVTGTFISSVFYREGTTWTIN